MRSPGIHSTKRYGTGADRVAAEVALPLAHRRRRHDRRRPHRQVGQERRVRAIDLELHAQRPGGAHVPDVVIGARPDEVGLVRRVLGHDLALEREHHRVGVERRAVVEADVPRAARSVQIGAVGADRPAGRQIGLGLEAARREAHQAAVDLLGDLQRFDVAGARRIQADRVGRARDDQPIATSAARRRLRAPGRPPADSERPAADARAGAPRRLTVAPSPRAGGAEPDPDLLLLGAVDAAQIGRDVGVLVGRDAHDRQRRLAAQHQHARMAGAAAAQLAILDEAVAARRATITTSRRRLGLVDPRAPAAAPRWRSCASARRSPASAPSRAAVRPRSGARAANGRTSARCASRGARRRRRAARDREPRAGERVPDARRSELAGARRRGQRRSPDRAGARPGTARPASAARSPGAGARGRRRSDRRSSAHSSAGQPASSSVATADPPALFVQPDRHVDVAAVLGGGLARDAEAAPSGTRSIRAPSRPGRQVSERRVAQAQVGVDEAGLPGAPSVQLDQRVGEVVQLLRRRRRAPASAIRRERASTGARRDAQLARQRQRRARCGCRGRGPARSWRDRRARRSPRCSRSPSRPCAAASARRSGLARRPARYARACARTRATSVTRREAARAR